MDFYVWSGLYSCIANLVIGLFVYLNSPKKSQNILFALFCLTVSLWSVGSFQENILSDKNLALLILRINYLFAVWLPAIYVNFVLTLTESLPRTRQIKSWVYCTLSAVLSPFVFTPWFIRGLRVINGSGFYISDPGPIYYAFFIFFSIAMVEVLANIYSSLKNASGNKRVQLKVLLLANAIAVLAGFEYFSRVFKLFDSPPLDDYILVIYVLCMAYAILRYQVLNVKILIKRTIIYSSLAVTVSLLYLLTTVIVQQTLLGEFQFKYQHLAEMPNPFVVSGILTGISCLSFGLFVFFKDTRRKDFQSWLFFSVAVSMWGFLGAAEGLARDPWVALWLVRCSIALGVIWIPVLFLHFVYRFNGEKTPKLVYWVYLIDLAIFPVIFTPLFFKSTRYFLDSFYYGVIGSMSLFTVYLAWWLFVFTYSLWVLYRSLRKSVGHRRNQNKYLFVAILIGAVGGSLNYLPYFYIDFYPWGNFAIPLYPIIMSYAILKHQLMDIRVAIRKTLIYSILAFIISTVCLSVVFLIQWLFLAEKMSDSSIRISILGMLVIAILFKPLEMLLHHFLERKFFKGTIGEISAQNERLEVELERRERLKSVGILAAGMAHEIKNPLAVIKTFTDYLPKKYDDPEFREKFNRIVNQEISRAADIVSDLLLFSKPAEPLRKNCDLAKILAEIIDILSSKISMANIRVNLKLESLPVFVDSGQIKQAFLNIIMNAIDAMRDGGGDLRITGFSAGDMQEIIIEDTGCGIPKDKLRHIFDPFFTTKEGGTGLGLAVTHSIVEKNGGQIKVESEIGKGTRFIVSLPAN